MQVKVSNPMGKFLAEALDKLGKVTIVRMTADEYRTMVDYDLFCHTEDWDTNKQTFKVFRLAYPSEYYANPAYITTRDLNRVFRESDRTAEGFTQALIAQYEI